MYYFKDHLNFSNNLQDNLYILRQRQLKEAAAWSPSSGGPAVPESAAGTNELKDRMRNIKQSGDRPQSKEYLEMDAEVKRREGTGSSGIPQSSDVKTDKVAGDWVERYARKLDMDPRKVENIRRGVIDMDTSGRGEDPISQTQDQVAQRGVEAYDKAKQYVVDLQKRDADKKASSVASTPASAPTTYRGFDRGDGLAKPEATTSVTPEDALGARTFANNNMTGEPQLRNLMGAASGPNSDNPWVQRYDANGIGLGSYSSKPQVGADPDVQRGQFPIRDPALSGYDDDVNIDASVNMRDPSAFLKYLTSLRQPRFSPKPADTSSGGSLGGPDPDMQRGQFNINDPDLPGYVPTADMVSPPKPSTEYGTDLIDQGKLIIGQESVNDILDRMRNPKERSFLDIKTANTEAIQKEVDDQYNKQKGSDWARNSFSLKNYFELRRDGAAAYAQAKEDYKTASSKPSWANSTPVIPVTPAKSKKSRPNIPRQ